MQAFYRFEVSFFNQLTSLILKASRGDRPGKSLVLQILLAFHIDLVSIRLLETATDPQTLLFRNAAHGLVLLDESLFQG
jgi:hypothetical protein